MAIKIGGTTVIDNSRVAQNLLGFYSSYDQINPAVTSVTSPGTSYVFSMNNPYVSLTLNANISITASNILSGKSSTLILSTLGAYTPTFSSSFQFSPAEPTWADHSFWRIDMMCVNGTDIRVFAHGFDS